MNWPIVIILLVHPCFLPMNDLDHHDHKPFWSRSILLGAFICSGGDW